MLQMGSLSGFRLPQFSEDETWLPAWLQPHKFNEHIKEGKSQSEPTFKELPFPQQNTWIEEDANGVSEEEGRYKSCHLFLSGEDNSALSFSPSSCNALHFHLHLSSDNYSEHTQSQFTEMSLAEMSESNHAMLMKCIGTSTVPEEKANQFKREVSRNAGLINVAPSSLLGKSDKLGPQYFSNNLVTGTKHEDDVRLLKVADISNAIELSVAASEALLIHEVIESGSTTKSLSASAILEVALLVKQARLESFKEALNFSHAESSDIDCLSDLDESTMVDAYEDVGLSVSPVARCDCDSISQVKDTYAMENYGSDNKLIYEEHGTPGVDSTDIFTKQKSKDVKSFGIQSKEDLMLQSLDSDRRKKLIDDLAQGLETSGVAVDVNSMLNCSIQENPYISSTKKKVDFAMEHVASFQETVNSSPQARISENAERYDLTYATPNKFQSRWLGGWTRKNERNASASMECNGAGRVPEYFVGETSLLSESAEIAPDGNSFVQNQDKRFSIVSQSSVPSKGLCTKNTDMYLYEDAVKYSSPSIVDSLCSVVPCSISPENACSALAHNQNDKADAGKCFSSILEHNENNLQRSTSLDMEFVNGQGRAVQETDAEGSQVIARRRVTSLRTFSTILPNQAACLGKESNYCGQSFPLECNENMIHSVVDCPIKNSTDKPRNYDESTKDKAELLIHMQKEIGSPGTKCFLRGSKYLLRGGEENAEHTAKLERDAELLKVEHLQTANSHNFRVLGRKRESFAEAKISFSQKHKLQTKQTTYKNCFTRSSGRLNSFNPHSESRAQELISCPKRYLDKSSRRLIFQNIEFLLAGFSGKKEKEIEGLIRKHGGMVLSDIPSPPSSRTRRSARFRRQPIPVILCFKKLETLNFLYGCAVKACMLTVDWLTDSISAGSVLPPETYSILPNPEGETCSGIGKPAPCNRYIFDNTGIMLHGKPNFCTKMAKVVKHGGGLVFKTLRWLVQSLEDEKISSGAIITEDESRVSRHLKHCASERKIPVMPDNWIINSLYAGKLLPVAKNNHSATSHRIKLLDIPVSVEMSEEI